jgi:hypothetical protein
MRAQKVQPSRAIRARSRNPINVVVSIEPGSPLRVARTAQEAFPWEAADITCNGRKKGLLGGCAWGDLGLYPGTVRALP